VGEDFSKVAEVRYRIVSHGELHHEVLFDGEHETEFSDLPDAKGYVAGRVNLLVEVAAKARADAIEEAAKVVGKKLAAIVFRNSLDDFREVMDLHEILEAIRSLAQPTNTKETPDA
jgi:hypothetical protein